MACKSVSIMSIMDIRSFFLGTCLGNAVLAACFVFLGRSAIVDWNHVPTGSMKPTILVGDWVLVNQLAYGLQLPFNKGPIITWAKPKRGDIVVFYSPQDGKKLLKRIVGVPGDTLSMHNNRLYINGQLQSHDKVNAEFISNITDQDRLNYEFVEETIGDLKHILMLSAIEMQDTSFAPLTIPKNKYFMMGDNRDNSADSRQFGLIDRSAILGQVTTAIISWNIDNHYLPRNQRYLFPLH